MGRWKRLLTVAAAVALAGGAVVAPGVVSGTALASTGPGSLHVFGVSTTGNLYQDTYGSTGGWTAWQDLGNNGTLLQGTPAIAYDPSDNSYHAFALGTNGDTYENTYTTTAGWGDWQSLGGVLQGGLSAVYVDGSFHVFGVSSSGNLYQDTWNGSWTGWQDIGNDNEALTGSPGIAYDSSDSSYHAFALGKNGNTYQVTYTPSTGWGNWQNLGGVLQGGLSATLVGTSFHVFGVSSSGNLYQDTYSGGWTGYQDIGNDNEALTGAPGIAYDTSDGSYHAFALGANHNMYQVTYTASTGWGNWQNLGGSLEGGFNATYVPQASSTAALIVSTAEGQEGYTDDPAGTYCNKYTFYWGAGSTLNCAKGTSSEEWCSDFAAWVWEMSGVSLTYGSVEGQDVNGQVYHFYLWGVAHGTWHAVGSGYTPQPGDLAVYGLDTSTQYAAHIAVVTSYTPGDAGPNAVNGDYNYDVQYVTDETSNTGSGNNLAGYVSP